MVRVRAPGATTEPRQAASKAASKEALMASSSKTTTDHAEIRTCAEQHDGKPARVRDKASGESSTFFKLVPR